MCHFWDETRINKIYAIPTNSESVPHVMNDDPFQDLGSHFDFKMSNRKHKSELVEILGSLMSNIDKLPIHSKIKLLLYQRYVLSKISLHLTIADFSRNLDL